MAEQEELKLIVSLTDNASSGLARLRGEMQKLGGGAGKDNEIQKQLEELGGGKTQLSLYRLQRGLESLQRGGLKPIIEGAAHMGGAFGVMGRMAGVASAGIGLVGAAAFAAHKSISGLSEEMNRWNQLSRQTGIAIGPLRQMADQMKAQGMDAAAIERTLSSVGASMARFGRDNARMRAEILRQTNPAGQEAMRQQLDELLPFARAGDAEGYANKVREIAAKVRAEVLRSGRGEQRAAAAERQTLDLFGIDASLQNFEGKFSKASAETIAHQERLNKLSKEYQTITAETAAAWGRVADAIGGITFNLFKDFFEDMRSFANWAAGWAEYFAGKKQEATPGVVPGVPLPRARPTPGSKFDEQFGGDDGMGGGPRSSVDELKNNIEEETEQSKKLTEEMGRLTDHLVAEAAKRDVEGGAGGDHGFEISASRRSGGGRGGGGGGADYGGGVDTGAGTGRGSSGRTAAEPGVPIPESGDATKTGSEYLKSQRERFAKEFEQNPNLKLRAAALLDLENPGAGPAVMESAMNRGAMTGRTMESILQGGPKSFYGPARRGMVEPRMRELMRNPAKLAARMRAIDAALAGSNLVKGHTDQGSAGDPNYSKGGTGVNINRERFNDWGGHRGVAYSRMWREQQQMRVNADRERRQLEAGASGGSVNVNGTGKIRVDVNAPPGTNVSAEAGGIFKDVETNRNIQMIPAGTGASDSFIGAP